MLLEAEKEGEKEDAKDAASKAPCFTNTAPRRRASW